MRTAVVVAAVACLACVRPGQQTIRPAAEEIIAAPPGETWRAALRAVSDQGLPLRYTDADDGVIETDYVSMESYRPEAAQYPIPERFVRFRVSVATDPHGRGSALALHGIYRPFATELGNTRRNERAVPRDHPAMDLVQELVARIRELAEQGG